METIQVPSDETGNIAPVAAKLWTPGSPQERSAGLQIWIPDSAQEKRKVRECSCCGTKFPMEQRSAFIRHVDKCAKVNEEVIDEEVHRHRGGDSAFDDYDSWREEYVHKRDEAAKKGIPVRGVS